MCSSHEENPNDEQCCKEFENLRDDIEKNINEYALKGILPYVDDDIVGHHKDKSVSFYKVISRTFYKNEILILVDWY